MKSVVNGLFYALIFAVLLFNTTATAIEQVGVGSEKNGKFVVATLYYGFKEYSWPINYLNAIKDSDIEAELVTIKKMGFNTVILLASWSEFEPIIGKPNNRAYRKISTIIATAKKHGLSVMIRIPYLWALAEGESNDIRKRIAYALLDRGDYRQALLNFLRNFNKNIIEKNDNVLSRFGSWEDYYVLRDLFFADEFFAGQKAVSDYVKESFFHETGIKSADVVRNGENYDIFNNWMNTKILGMTKDIGSYGYEIRTDADLYTKNQKPNWHFHNKFYKNESNGDLVAYWAPYFGQQNQGEKINADQAIKTFAWMLDQIAAETNKPPFIDQLNFFDNSPGTEANAQIEVGQLGDFFEKMSAVLVDRTAGYAFWTIRDYRHNVIFNPAFSEKLTGWKASKNVIAKEDYVMIPPGGYLSQYVPVSRLKNLDSKLPSLVVDAAAGKGDVLIDAERWLSVAGPGRHAVEISTKDSLLAQSKFERSVNITIRASEDNSDGLKVKWVGLLGHAQIGKVFDESGAKGEFYDLIRAANERTVQLANRSCRGFEQNVRSLPYSRGVFSDGWTSQSFELCDPNINMVNGFVMVYYNPMPDKRSAQISVDGVVVKTVVLEKGAGKIRMCLPQKNSSLNINFVVSSPFIPGKLDKRSPDIRSLGVLLNSFEKIKCH